jgi:hypothetical protein
MRLLSFLLLLVLIDCSPAGIGGARAGQPDPAQKKITLDLKDVPLREALARIFAGSGLNYAVEPAVPNVPVTLTLKDVPLIDAVRRLVRIASVQFPRLMLGYDAEVYVLRVLAQPPPMADDPPPQDPGEQAPDEVEYHWEKIPVNFKNVAHVVPVFGGVMVPGPLDPSGALRPLAPLPPALGRFIPGGFGVEEPLPILPPDLLVIGDRTDNSIIVRGTDASIAELKTLLRLIDIPAEQVLVRIATDRLHAEGEVMDGAPLELVDCARAARFKARLIPRLNRDSAVELSVDATFTDGHTTYPLKTRVRLAPGVPRRIAVVGAGKHRIPVWVRAISLPQLDW